MSNVEWALLKSCHHALLCFREHAYQQMVTQEEVADVTDALELVLIELWSGKATGNRLLLESMLSGIPWDSRGSTRRESLPGNTRHSSKGSPTPSVRCPPGRRIEFGGPERRSSSDIRSSMVRCSCSGR